MITFRINLPSALITLIVLISSLESQRVGALAAEQVTMLFLFCFVSTLMIPQIILLIVKFDSFVFVGFISVGSVNTF